MNIDKPARVYTREFDRTMTGAELVAGLPPLDPVHLAPPALAERLAGDLFVPDDDDVSVILVEMAGKHREDIGPYVALVDLLAQALEAAGRRFEVLGFTTTDWKGGPILQRWHEAGRPDDLGRMCPLLHVVFKDAGQPWGVGPGSARTDFGQSMRPGVLKEGVEGEAVDWAARRLRDLPASERRLLVVSGARPADELTIKVNGPAMLEIDLQRAVGRARRDGIQVGAVCVGPEGCGADYYERRVGVKPRFDPVEAASRVLLDAFGAKLRAEAGIAP